MIAFAESRCGRCVFAIVMESAKMAAVVVPPPGSWSLKHNTSHE